MGRRPRPQAAGSKRISRNRSATASQDQDEPDDPFGGDPWLHKIASHPDLYTTEDVARIAGVSRNRVPLLFEGFDLPGTNPHARSRGRRYSPGRVAQTLYDLHHGIVRASDGLTQRFVEDLGRLASLVIETNGEPGLSWPQVGRFLNVPRGALAFLPLPAPVLGTAEHPRWTRAQLTAWLLLEARPAQPDSAMRDNGR
jgi:hypothetical protein